MANLKQCQQYVTYRLHFSSVLSMGIGDSVVTIWLDSTALSKVKTLFRFIPSVLFSPAFISLSSNSLHEYCEFHIYLPKHLVEK